MGSREGDGGDGDGEGDGGKGEELAARGLGGVKREPFIPVKRRPFSQISSNDRKQEVQQTSVFF